MPVEVAAAAAHIPRLNKTAIPLKDVRSTPSRRPGSSVKATMDAVAVGIPSGDNTRHAGASTISWKRWSAGHGIAAIMSCTKSRKMGQPLTNMRVTYKNYGGK